jgi:hypothetical protein
LFHFFHHLGVPIHRFGPQQSPLSFEKEIKALLDVGKTEEGK